ncbi:metallophosphoesterase family protein [Thermomicrobiaceae bacterium CFH 74404]|uniref:Metallophosphoesterase family protein n=1 Tax=Thermalbibacter longus TaxID=2951981 RepID=A0AA41W9F4_9BACT|nr:metallophosphoesterase family protein [Thermalbibacter longus]MCM8748129.1 metallophosphoesterase family protein [Thermalbibacter longus]
MSLGQVVALLADVHGEQELLRRVLELCRTEGVDTIVLLGDLIDRPDQADRCALLLAGWPVIGVYGNHERELALAARQRDLGLRQQTITLLQALRDRIVIEGVCLTHDVTGEDWGVGEALGRVASGLNGSHPSRHPRLTFAGHTHYRQARDDRGPLDLSRGRVELDPRRRYLINPGPVVAGQFAIWYRPADVVVFREVDPIASLKVPEGWRA